MERFGRLAMRASGAMLVALVGFGAGRRGGAAMPRPDDPALLTGADWAVYGPKARDAYLNGFIAGAAAEQVRALATTTDTSADSGAVSSAAIVRLRAEKQLRFSYAPSVYAAQIDDFYWWTDHRGTPIVDALITINGRMKDQ